LPTYEYLCEACGKRYEKREGFDAPAHQKCIHCGKRANRVLHAPPVVFKGSGFYKTDSRGTSSATADSGPSTTPSTPASDGAESSSTPSTDTPSTTEAAAAG